MKATKNQLATVARALLCGSTRLGSVNLTVDKFRAAIEGGHPSVGGMKFDTPKQSVLEGVIAEICAEFAGGLAVPGSVVLVTADNIGTFVRKTGEVAVRRRVTSDCGKARPAVAWIHKLRVYVGAIKRDGAAAVSAKVRNGLVAEFNRLTSQDMACLNVGDDGHGFGLVKAKSIIGNMTAAESEALTAFAERQANAAARAEESDKLRAAKSKAAERKPGTRKRKPVSVVQSVKTAQLPSIVTIAPALAPAA